VHRITDRRAQSRLTKADRNSDQDDGKPKCQR
jgi:hypothetical protein